MRTIRRAYYAKGIGRICCVFFGSWCGLSWESPADAGRNLRPWQRQQKVAGVIDVGTHDEVWS